MVLDEKAGARRGYEVNAVERLQTLTYRSLQMWQLIQGLRSVNLLVMLLEKSDTNHEYLSI